MEREQQSGGLRPHLRRGNEVAEDRNSIITTATTATTATLDLDNPPENIVNGGGELPEFDDTIENILGNLNMPQPPPPPPMSMGYVNHIYPRSLFNSLIPSLMTMDTSGYIALKDNHNPPIEKQDLFEGKSGVVKLTSENWKKWLIPKKSIVYVPISRIEMHHSIIEKEGHDKYIELRYIRGDLYEDDYQLTFEYTNIEPTYYACKGNKIDKYRWPVILKLTSIEEKRFEIKKILLEWKCIS
jgi:hypothetical protein